MAVTTYESMEQLSKYERLEEKHWSECRQIAHYDDELKAAQELLIEAAWRVGGEFSVRISEFLEGHKMKDCELIPINPDERGYTDRFECMKCKGIITTHYMQTACDYKYCPYCGSKILEG